MDSFIKGLVGFPVSLIETIVADHLEVFFGDMFDE